MHLAVVLGIILIIILVGYAIFLFWAYINRRFIFSPYVPNLGPNLFQPGGQPFELTADEIECRQYSLGFLKGTIPAKCANVDPYARIDKERQNN